MSETAESQTPNDVKTFVLDTNVLLHNPDALFVFEENDVVVPFAVVEELDDFKRGNEDLARNARRCIRHLDRLRLAGRLTEGVPWGENGAPTAGRTGRVRVVVGDSGRPPAISADTPDNRIIGVAFALKDAGQRAIFVSKDINARIKADALGLTAQDFEFRKVDADRLFTGFFEVDTTGDVIDELYEQRMLPLEKITEQLSYTEADGSTYEHELSPNEFVVLKDLADDSHSGLARRLADTNHLIPISSPRKPVFGVMSRNTEQTLALDLLLDDDIRLVTLTGGAGTGKTLLALAAGMSKVFQEERYDKLLVARPIVPMGKDIGYLPGEKDEKLSAWMQPIFDNLEYLLSTRGSAFQSPESISTEQRLERLLADGKLMLEALTYIRGRSIPNQFMIVDEAQNLTPHEVKTIISRAGEGTKLILTGDIEQIDNPYLDSASNGLSFAIERMKGSGIVGHVTLIKSERSELASLAAENL